MAESTPELDAVTLEVIRNALPAVANEMAADLQRTSYNMMIYEVRDFCTALIDTKGQLISQNVGGVSHFVADLGAGCRIAGPALIQEHGTTTVLFGGDALEMAPSGEMIITVGGA